MKDDTHPLWQRELAQAVGRQQELIHHLHLPPEAVSPDINSPFPLRVPRPFLEQMRKQDPADPLLKQVMISPEENEPVEGFDEDPVGDMKVMPVPGLLHKYEGRVLLTVTGACAIHCRYCFRRHYPYAEANPLRERWPRIMDYLRNDTSIREVILSGGDPLVLRDERLAKVVTDLNTLPHLQRLRIHTRTPVVLPSRVTEELLAWMADSRLPIITVLHINHAREISPQAGEAIQALRQNSQMLLNQAVLLRDVNDSLVALTDLSEALAANGIVPYYLHLLDRVSGAAHFEVEATRAIDLIDSLRQRLPGYMVPSLVREISGEPSKTPVGRETLHKPQQT